MVSILKILQFVLFQEKSQASYMDETVTILVDTALIIWIRSETKSEYLWTSLYQCWTHPKARSWPQTISKWAVRFCRKNLTDI
jgi:hypothetical protein